MAKGLDLLFLSKVDNNNSFTKSSKSSKKEGLSLFDKMFGQISKTTQAINETVSSSNNSIENLKENIQGFADNRNLYKSNKKISKKEAVVNINNENLNRILQNGSKNNPSLLDKIVLSSRNCINIDDIQNTPARKDINISSLNDNIKTLNNDEDVQTLAKNNILTEALDGGNIPTSILIMKSDEKENKSKHSDLIKQDATSKNINEANIKPNEVLANIYLGSLKNSINEQMLNNKSEALKIVKSGKSVNDVKIAAQKLDLNPKDALTQIENFQDIVNDLTLTRDKSMDLNRLAFFKNLRKNDFDRIVSNIKITSEVPSSTLEDKTIGNVISLYVPSNANLSIQNRIIGAQQQISSMMSDVAKNMYENYKPPLTTFRINLFPAQLGQITIKMKNRRNNTINISMDISSPNTLNIFVQHQNILKDALDRNFKNDDTSFNLDFNIQKKTFDNFSSSNQENNSQQQEYKEIWHPSTQILEAIEEDQVVAENLNYM